MIVDHIFIFSQNQGGDAEELLDFGLAEGSSRIHQGQGTTNRKFYFENFFLEILWVHDTSEIQSPVTSVTGLWERSNFKENNHSPFGLCLDNTGGTEALFQNSQKYQPAYFPEGMHVDFINSKENKDLPWLFRLPMKGPKKPTTEPTNHRLGLKKLTKAEFQLPQISNWAKNCQSEQIQFKKSGETSLTIEFDRMTRGKEHFFESLPLSIRY